MMRAFVAALLLSAIQFSASVDLVEVYASATRPSGEAVEDLRAEDFIVLENGVEQKIQAFARGDFPLSVVLAIDRSFSMSGPPLRLAREAARAFLNELRPEDHALVVAIGTEVEPLGELSRDRKQQYAALDSLMPWGTTSLHDAIIDVVDRVSAGVGRRAVILLSDGKDRYSKAPADVVVARVRRSDVLVYGISIGAEAPPLFLEVARLSGGRAHHVKVPQQLGAVFSTIARELRTQYLLGYTPPPGPAGWRSITVRVARPDVTVRARAGYVAR
jgi:Ca-activated chloride channel family protein